MKTYTFEITGTLEVRACSEPEARMNAFYTIQGSPAGYLDIDLQSVEDAEDDE